MSWCRAQSGTFDLRYYFFFFESYSPVQFGAPSLMRGRVCHLSVCCQYRLQWYQYVHTIYTLCYTQFTIICKNMNHDSVRTSQETHYVSATETSRLMLFRETVAVYCENHMEHIKHSVGRKLSPYLTGNTLSPLKRPTG
jgi:hypothetical protein